jgi:hypothetical protein
VCLRCRRTRYSFRKNDLSVDYTSLMERFNTRRVCSSRELTSALPTTLSAIVASVATHFLPMAVVQTDLWLRHRSLRMKQFTI